MMDKMIRDILFRGKRKDTKEWVYGYLVKDTKKNEWFIFNRDYTSIISGMWSCYVEVIPETVGQYTGLKDKNGKMIFEGDLVNTDDGDDWVIEEKVAVVFKDGCFYAGTHPDKKYHEKACAAAAKRFMPIVDESGTVTEQRV